MTPQDIYHFSASLVKPTCGTHASLSNQDPPSIVSHASPKNCIGQSLGRRMVYMRRLPINKWTIRSISTTVDFLPGSGTRTRSASDYVRMRGSHG